MLSSVNTILPEDTPLKLSSHFSSTKIPLREGKRICRRAPLTHTNVILRGHAGIHKQANYSLGLLLPSPLLMQFLFGGRETRERQILQITKNDVRRVCSKRYWEDPRIPLDVPVAPEFSWRRSLHRAAGRAHYRGRSGG